MFRIIVKYIYKDTYKIIDSSNNYDDAINLLYEYKLSFGSKYELKILEE